MSAQTIAILGAGAMGSALTTPLLGAGHRVRLWGTERDDHLLAAIREGEPHPRLGVVSTAPRSCSTAPSLPGRWMAWRLLCWR